MEIVSVDAVSVEELVEKLKPRKDNSILLAIVRKFHTYRAYLIDLEGEGFTVERYPPALSREEWADMLFYQLKLRPETIVICLNPILAFIPTAKQFSRESFLV